MRQPVVNLQNPRIIGTICASFGPCGYKSALPDLVRYFRSPFAPGTLNRGYTVYAYIWWLMYIYNDVIIVTDNYTYLHLKPIRKAMAIIIIVTHTHGMATSSAKERR